MLFSEREGLVPRKALQIDFIDEELRNRLWTALHLVFWRTVDDSYTSWPSTYRDIYSLIQAIWINFLKRPIDTMPESWGGILRQIRDWYFRSSWNQVYDFLEFVVLAYRSDHP